MIHSILPGYDNDVESRFAEWVNGFARRLVLNKLSGLRRGCLVIVEDGMEQRFGLESGASSLKATIRIRHPRFFRSAAFEGSVGAGESYIRGDWACDDLTALTRIFIQNRDVLDSVDGGLGSLFAPVHRLFHWLNRNTLTGSRRNIEAHYDLGNDLFEQFLDPTMMYSCAVFDRPGATLQEASLMKLDTICRKLQLGPGDEVIEIGSGWGGFALYAARHYGCSITTTTISRQQYQYVSHKVNQAGLKDRINILQQDYRELEGLYDKLVSIEMIEAVGHENYPVFFRKCGELLKDDGMMLLQTITIADQRYQQARREVDFIKRYIFPGGCLPSVTAITELMTSHTDLRMFHAEDIGPHYAVTLRKWRENFIRNLDAIRSLGYDEQFRRLWEFYLCYCEGAFLERAIGNIQVLAVKPQCRRESLAVRSQQKDKAA